MSFFYLLNVSLRWGKGPYYMSPEEKFWTTGILIAMGIATLIYIVYKSFEEIKRSKWDKGIIPKNFEPTQENIYEIFIAASSAMVVRDLDNYYMKFSYIDKFLFENFKNVYYQADESYDYSMRHVVKINSLANWSNKHLSTDMRIKMINFLAGIAAYDGGINDEEQRYLLALMAKLNLDLTDFEPIYQEKLTRKNERRYRAQASSSGQDFFYTVLGLEKSATIEEVKIAYRKLVKLTHPDRFMNESPEVQKQMSEKFREIQTAYESIVNS